jgi:hypothetical protein
LLNDFSVLFRNQDVVQPPKNATDKFALPSNHKNNSQLIDRNNFKVNARYRVAESRLFPVGHPSLIPQNLVSPFDVATFGKQLLPLINVNIKEKVKDFARTFNSGADYIEDAIRESWRESPLNPHNFKNLLEKPNLFKHLPFGNAVAPTRKPIHPPPTSHHTAKAPKEKAPKEKTPKAIETYSVDGLMKEYGINGYKHFEKSILRELEKQEELKVEATIHTLFEHGDKVKSVEIVRGKPYDGSWQPVAAPTKNYEDDKEVHSQIISPLHTSIFGESQLASIAPHDISADFHDFDHLNSNTLHSTYAVHEEEGESKVKPVKTRITPVRKVTPSPPGSNRYRKRHNNNTVKSVDHEDVPDSGASGSHVAPKVVKSNHIQSLTTTKPKSTTVSPLDDSKKESSNETAKPINSQRSSDSRQRQPPPNQRGPSNEKPASSSTKPA